MTTSKIIDLHRRAVQIADQSFVKRATERIQALLKVAIEHGFGTEETLYVCSGNGSSSIEIDSCKVIYHDEPGVEHDSENVSIRDYLESEGDYLYRLVVNPRAKEALGELCILCEAIVELKLTCNVGWKIYANNIKRDSWTKEV